MSSANFVFKSTFYPPFTAIFLFYLTTKATPPPKKQNTLEANNCTGGPGRQEVKLLKKDIKWLKHEGDLCLFRDDLDALHLEQKASH